MLEPKFQNSIGSREAKLRLTYFFLTLLALSSRLALADFDAVHTCLDQKYKKLSNHRAIAVAVVAAENTKLLVYGQAKVNQIFEIGSITKTFTANLLAQEVVTGGLKLSDAIPSEYQKQSDVSITYQHLTTHTSGIIPGNFPDFHGPNPESPYEGLSTLIFKDLYTRTPLLKDAAPGRQWSYSNIGIGLLGLILAERNHTTYEDLVTSRIFKAIGMTDSYFAVPTTESARFPRGNINGEPWSYWNLYDTAISPAGGIRSTIGDMALYAKANLVPEWSPLTSAINLSHEKLYYIEDQKRWIGMNWFVEPEKNLIWHNGSTLAFNSILAMSSKHDVAVVALTDTGIWTTDEAGQTVKDDSFQNVVFDCLRER